MRKVFVNAFLLAILSGVIGTASVKFATAQDKKEKAKAAAEAKTEKKDKEVKGAVEAKAEADKESKAVTSIEIYKDNAGEFRFRIKNGDTVLAMASKGHKTKADCEKVIEIIQRDVGKAKVDEKLK